MDPLTISDHLPSRKNLRIENHDYCQPGGYFVTICTLKMANLFGSVDKGHVNLNTFGKIVQTEWFNTSRIRQYVMLYEDEFILMPNHLHGIIWITKQMMTNSYKDPAKSGPRSRSLGAIIGQFKSTTTRRINKIRKSPGESIWQRNYYDHIIRNEKDLQEIQRYILNNPMKWEDDKKNR